MNPTSPLRIFKSSRPALSGPGIVVQVSWLVERGAHEVMLVIRDGQARLFNRQGQVLDLTPQAARAINLHSRHTLHYREHSVEGQGWRGHYRLYDGRLSGVVRFVLEEGTQLPTGVGREVTDFDLEVNMAPIRSTNKTSAR